MVSQQSEHQNEGEESPRRMKTSRKRKTISDYQEVAEAHGFEWVGGVLPGSTLEETKWKCKRAGHIWETRYNKIHEGRQCPYCSGHWHKREEDYHKLAEKNGIKWIGDSVPENSRTLTLWQLPDNGEKFVETYRNIASRSKRVADRPAIALRQKKEMSNEDPEG